jgi:hypothetical protein
MKNCPYCKEEVVILPNPDTLKKIKPKKGAMSVCLFCGELLVFETDNCDVRKMTKEEYEELPTETKQHLEKAKLIGKLAKFVGDKEESKQESDAIMYR